MFRLWQVILNYGGKYEKQFLIGLAIVILVFTMSGVSEALSINPNVALLGTASQSSTYSYSTPADLAIDGNHFNGSVNHTQNDVAPYAWWEVNLGQEYYIDEIDIWNRTDSDCADRLFPFTLSVLENDRDVAWSSSIIISQDNPLIFSRPDVVGQFVFN
ncbi:MAG: discoidin domain-containing protein [Deltaproteobacteria bacterium]|nr:discoidin domain-containing protein [Deltaproteobacteria bacterium]